MLIIFPGKLESLNLTQTNITLTSATGLERRSGDWCLKQMAQNSFCTEIYRYTTRHSVCCSFKRHLYLCISVCPPGGAQISLTAVSMSVTMYQYLKLHLSTLLSMAIFQDSKNHINVILYIDKYLSIHPVVY